MLNKIFRKRNNQVSFLVCSKEYDSPELRELLKWFEKDGWISKEKSCDIVGSQELTVCELTKDKLIAQLVFETYQGVTLFTSQENENLFIEIKTNI